jgi:hypothetical protein
MMSVFGPDPPAVVLLAGGRVVVQLERPRQAARQESRKWRMIDKRKLLGDNRSKKFLQYRTL